MRRAQHSVNQLILLIIVLHANLIWQYGPYQIVELLSL